MNRWTGLKGKFIIHMFCDRAGFTLVIDPLKLVSGLYAMPSIVTDFHRMTHISEPPEHDLIPNMGVKLLINAQPPPLPAAPDIAD